MICVLHSLEAIYSCCSIIEAPAELFRVDTSQSKEVPFGSTCVAATELDAYRRTYHKSSLNTLKHVIYAGTGETTIRIDVSFGDGMYRSTDAGRTWKHIGLQDSKQIGEIRVHPNNPDHLYVAGFGDAFGPSSERVVYRFFDGGVYWE